LNNALAILQHADCAIQISDTKRSTA
jgi:hypothetical protein